MFQQNVYICHSERCAKDPEFAKGTKRESKNPEDFLLFMLHQGVLTILHLLSGTITNMVSQAQPFSHWKAFSETPH